MNACGPSVFIANEMSCSDGDIFAERFKQAKAGPVIGMNTWGGIVGMNTVMMTVDNAMVMSPCMSNWFRGIGHGIDPNIEVNILPQHVRDGNDPQLERAIKEAMQRLEMYEKLAEDSVEKGSGSEWTPLR